MICRVAVVQCATGAVSHAGVGGERCAMTRRYGDSIDVRAAPDDAGAPEVFLWRGRLYVVQAVLGHWRERRAWWTARAARVLHGEETDADPESAARPEEAPGGRSSARSPLGGEHEVWRVEASSGRSAGGGVYDLRRDLSVGPDAAGDAWQLLRVAD